MNRQPVRIPLPIKQDVGLGDAVKQFLDQVGVRFDRCSCDARRKTLNSWLQFSASKGNK
jgi:hypothetical protein